MQEHRWYSEFISKVCEKSVGFIFPSGVIILRLHENFWVFRAFSCLLSLQNGNDVSRINLKLELAFSSLPIIYCGATLIKQVFLGIMPKTVIWKLLREQHRSGWSSLNVMAMLGIDCSVFSLRKDNVILCLQITFLILLHNRQLFIERVDGRSNWLVSVALSNAHLGNFFTGSWWSFTGW